MAPSSVPGLVHLWPDGSTFATAGPEEGRRGHPPGGAELAGGFTVTVTRVERGWPFATTVILGPARLDLEMFRPKKESRHGVLVGEDRVSAEIAALLADLGVEHGLTRRRRGAWIGNALILSLLLPMATWVAFAVAARCAAVASRARVRARRERLAEGRCSVCGYDLRGNPYGAQCPECGNVSR
jgi:hypothetical protein